MGLLTTRLFPIDIDADVKIKTHNSILDIKNALEDARRHRTAIPRTTRVTDDRRRKHSIISLFHDWSAFYKVSKNVNLIPYVIYSFVFILHNKN